MPPYRLLHLSDPHFGTEQPAVVQALLELARQWQPQVIVLSGDITQRATRRQFDAASQFVQALPPAARMIIPGNHDIPLFAVWARAFAPYARYRQAFPGPLEPRLAVEGFAVAGHRTTRRWRHKHGQIDAQQARESAQWFGQSDSEATLRIAVTHQPVCVPRPAEEPNLLRGREAALDAWEGAGVDLVLSGHIHLPYVLPVRAADATGVGPPAHETEQNRAPARGRLWAVGTGTAVSSRIRSDAPNSVTLIAHDGQRSARRASVQQWDYAAGSGFALRREVTLPLRGRGAQKGIAVPS